MIRFTNMDDGSLYLSLPFSTIFWRCLDGHHGIAGCGEGR